MAWRLPCHLPCHRLVVPLVGRGFVVVGSGGGDLYFGAVVHAEGAFGDDHVAGLYAAGDLGVVAVGDADFDGHGFGDAVGAHDHDCGVAFLAGDDGLIGDGEDVSEGLYCDLNVGGRAGFELTFTVGEHDPDLDGGGAGVECGRDERDFAFAGRVEAGDGDDGGGAGLHLLRLGFWPTWTLAMSDEVSMTVRSGAPAWAISPGKSGRSVTTPEMGERISE
jgi:hypothetical protein